LPASNFGGLNPAEHPKLAQAIQLTRSWLAGPGGAVLLIGNTGEGKSHLGRAAIATTRGPIPAANPDGLFITESQFLAQIRESYDSVGQGEMAIMRRLGAARVLVFDDVGAAQVKESSLGWYQGLMTRLMDARSADGRWTLISTNVLDLEAFERLIGARAWSRLKALLGEGQPGNQPWKRSIAFMAGIGDQRDAGRAGTVKPPMVTHHPATVAVQVEKPADGLTEPERFIKSLGYDVAPLIAEPVNRVRLGRAYMLFGAARFCEIAGGMIIAEPDIPPGELAGHLAKLAQLEAPPKRRPPKKRPLKNGGSPKRTATSP